MTPTHDHIRSRMGRVESLVRSSQPQSFGPVKDTVDPTPHPYCGPGATALINFTVWSLAQRMCQSEERELHYDGKRTERGSTPLLSVTETRRGGVCHDSANDVYLRRMCDESVRARQPEGLLGMCYMTFF